MFIELADYLKCPGDHDPEPCVVLPETMAGRSVLEGLVGCPVCRREYPIRAGRVVFGEAPGGGIRQEFDPQIVRALLGLESPGGYVALVGASVALADELADGMKVQFVGFNAPVDYAPGTAISLMDTAGPLPLKTNTVRGVVLDAAHVSTTWLEESSRIVLPGQRVVVAAEDVPESPLERLAVGHGYWVGRKG